MKSSERIGPHNIDVLSILVGSLLGDGWGEKRSNSTRFHIHCSAKNVEYIMWLHKYLSQKGYCSTVKPKILKQIGENGNIYYSIKIRTWSFTSLNYIYDSFYLDMVKVVPSLEFLNQLKL
jgi:ubiquinol-cytochrome c reductase cytochrome b subunit